VYLIVGLGNPGPIYESTRHNIGFKTIDLWSHELGVRLKSRSFQSRNIQIRFQGRKVMLLCPLTFMNQSGMAVRACADYYDLELENLLVIHDDVDLPVGRLKVVRDSGAGGHKGVQSIIGYLGSIQFPRIKIGIGRPRYGETIEDYVLAPFYSDERDIIERVLHEATQACNLFVSEGVERAMNHINCQKLANEEEKN
jgi:PTH1 family peptidyl-tRNA hydrolase